MIKKLKQLMKDKGGFNKAEVGAVMRETNVVPKSFTSKQVQDLIRMLEKK